MASESDMIKIVNNAKSILDALGEDMVYNPVYRLAIDYYTGEHAHSAIKREIEYCETAEMTLQTLSYTKLL